MNWRAVLLSSVLLTVGAQPAAADLPALLVDLGLGDAAADEVDVQRLQSHEGATSQHRCDCFDMGRTLLRQGQADAAVRMFTLAAELPAEETTCALSDAAIDAWTALAQVRAAQQPQAVARLLRLEQFADDPQVRHRASHLRCVLHLHAAEPEAGRACAIRWLHLRDDDPQLHDLTRDPDAAAVRGGLLSALLPGLGQATAERGDEAAAALGVNAALGYGTASLFVEGQVLDGVLLTVAMTARYYIGNIWHGADAWRNLALQQRNRAGRALADRLLAVPAVP